MNVIQRSADEEDLNLFDESDWDFLNITENSRNFQYFEEVPDIDFSYDEHRNVKLLFFTILSSVLGVLVAILIVVCYEMYMSPVLSTQEEYEKSLQLVDNTRITHIEGASVGSDKLIDIASVVNTYFNTLKSQSDYENLNRLCLTGSNFVQVEGKYRKSAKSSYDEEDCYARALREFSRFIKLEYVDEIIYKDGVYYCYVMLSVPNSDELFEYLMGYRYEMTKSFKTSVLDHVNITRYLLSVMANNDIPTKNKEYLFKITNIDGKYLINDDSQITNICTEAYNSAISNIVLILGGTLVDTQYE